MLKFYVPETKIYINSEEPIEKCIYKNRITESHPNTEIIRMNWDNLLEKYNEIDRKIDRSLPFEICKRRKGLEICFNHWIYETPNFRQWKEKFLDIEIKTTWSEYKPSIQEIFNFHDADNAIKYLVERGMTSIIYSKN